MCFLSRALGANVRRDSKDAAADLLGANHCALIDQDVSG